MAIVFPESPAPSPQPLTRELERLRRGTKRFIEKDPREIVLWRPVKIANGSGGWLRDAPLGIYQQTMRLIPQPLGVEAERQKPEGAVTVPTWVLQALHNAEMRRGDYLFMPDGQVAQIVYVHEKKAYQTKGEVSLVGSEG